MERSTIDERPRTAPSDDIRRRPPRPRTARSDGAPRRTMRVPRSRGAVSGFLLVLLGIWGGLIPFVGPYFGYEFGSDQTWLVNWNRVWLDILPGAALVLGGLILLGSANRARGAFGGWLALAGGIWFVAGPTVSMLWDGTLGPANAIGQPLGSNGGQVLELLGYFYALGAVATALAAFALGRLAVVGVRDVELARDAPAYRRPAATAPATADGDGIDESAPPRRRRIFSRR